MKVKVFDASHELDLENDINAFIRNVEVIDIKYSVAASIFADEQVYCFSTNLRYNLKKNNPESHKTFGVIVNQTKASHQDTC